MFEVYYTDTSSLLFNGNTSSKWCYCGVKPQLTSESAVRTELQHTFNSHLTQKNIRQSKGMEVLPKHYYICCLLYWIAQEYKQSYNTLSTHDEIGANSVPPKPFAAPCHHAMPPTFTWNGCPVAQLSFVHFNSNAANHSGLIMSERVWTMGCFLQVTIVCPRYGSRWWQWQWQ